MGSVPIGVQCPLTFSLFEFLGYWAGSGLLLVLVSIAFHLLCVFPFTLLHLPLDSFMFLLFRSTLHLLTFR